MLIAIVCNLRYQTNNQGSKLERYMTPRKFIVHQLSDGLSIKRKLARMQAFGKSLLLAVQMNLQLFVSHG